ncbi:MAG: hypothetical protein ABFE08_02425 [Armatimonadia bacterium]
MSKIQEDALAGLAQDMMSNACVLGAKRDRIALAKKALKICPDNVDALMLLAEDASSDADGKLQMYLTAVEAGKRKLKYLPKGGDAIRWWSEPEMHPYMHALFGLARSKWDAGRHREAIADCEQLLAMNPDDNQRVRYYLLHYLVALRDALRIDKLKKEQLAVDQTAAALYPLALWAYLSNGPCPEADTALQLAIASNPHLPAYLLGVRSLTRKRPSQICLGSREEAHSYMTAFGFVWLGAYPELSYPPWMRARAERKEEARAAVFETHANVDRSLKYWIYDCLVGLRGLRVV